MLEFKNADVAAKYESDKKSDPVTHMPGKKATGFKCRLSQMTLAQADKLYACPGQNSLRLKAGAAVIKFEKPNRPKEETPS